MRRRLAIAAHLLRFALAASLTLWLASHWHHTRAHLQLDALPDMDFTGLARDLMAESRHAEALMVLDAAEASPELAALRAEIETDRDQWQRWGRAALTGAWTGEGDTPAALGGAIGADLLVFGDVRDLVIQGHRAWRGQPTDPLLIALSTAGIVLTVTPVADLGMAVLKFARRSGALSARVGGQLLEMARGAVRSGGDVRPLQRATLEVGKISQRHSPAVSTRLLKVVDDVDELPALRRLADQPSGTFALWLGGRPAFLLAQREGEVATRLLKRAGRKGEAGLALALRESHLLLKPHPFLGLVKTLYKGRVPQALEMLSPQVMLALLVASMAWLALSSVRLWGQLQPSKSRRNRLPPALNPSSGTRRNDPKKPRVRPMIGV